MAPGAKIPRSEDVYKVACQFYMADLLIRKRPDRASMREETRVPEATIIAFTVELFLKCIYIEQKDEDPGKHKHNLYQLYLELDAKTRQRIQELWDIQMRPVMVEMNERNGQPVVPTDILGCLKTSKDAFRTLRYIYEQGGSETKFNLSGMHTVLLDYILEMRPDWAPPKVRWRSPKGDVVKGSGVYKKSKVI
jgi:hypothetical protein